MSLKDGSFVAEHPEGGHFVVLKESDIDIAVAELKKRIEKEFHDCEVDDSVPEWMDIVRIVDEVFEL